MEVPSTRTKYEMVRFWKYVWEWAQNEAPLTSPVNVEDLWESRVNLENNYIQFQKTPSPSTWGAYLEAQREWMLRYARWTRQEAGYYRKP